MKSSTATLGIFTLFMAAAVGAQTPPPKAATGKAATPKAAQGKTATAKPAQNKPAPPKAEVKTDPLARAQERAVANYRQNQQREAAQQKQRAAKAAAVRTKAAARRSRATVVSPAVKAKKQAAALARAQEYAVANYRRNMGLPVAEAPRPAIRRENLACFTGDEDRHARIGVELVNDQVTYFAYYSKWKPRTCSIEAQRGGPYSRWTDNGSISTVTLVDQKGTLRIERKGGAYRFAFVNVDRGRYCGMDGRINGSLTVTRGKRSCVVQGVMDGHAL